MGDRNRVHRFVSMDPGQVLVTLVEYYRGGEPWREGKTRIEDQRALSKTLFFVVRRLRELASLRG